MKYELSVEQVKVIISLLNQTRMNKEEEDKFRTPILKALSNPIKEVKK